eukprot:473329_1
MCTLLRHQLIGLIAFTTLNALNTFISDNDTFWQSTSDFIPIHSSHSDYYGHIRLWEHMSMSFDLEFHGRVSNLSSNTKEQMFRVGWPAYTMGNQGFNSRYPSLWLGNAADVFHFSLSHANDGGWGQDFNSFPLVPHTIYSVHIEWNDTWVYFKADDSVLQNHPRSFHTSPEYIGRLLNVYIASDSVSNITSYPTANVTLRNIVIQTTPPTRSPTLSTATPTTQPTAPSDTPTSTPTNNPTVSPSFNPITTNPSSNPTSTPITIDPTFNPTSTAITSSPSAGPTSTPITTNPSSYPSSTPISTNPSTAQPTTAPTADPSDATMTTSSPADGPTDIYTDPPTLAPTEDVTSEDAAPNYIQWWFGINRSGINGSVFCIILMCYFVS